MRVPWSLAAPFGGVLLLRLVQPDFLSMCSTNSVRSTAHAAAPGAGAEGGAVVRVPVLSGFEHLPVCHHRRRDTAGPVSRKASSDAPSPPDLDHGGLRRMSDPSLMHDAESAKRGPGRPRHADTEERAYRAVLELFGQKGFDGMSLDAVAKSAGVGKSSIYLRWKNKRKLLLEAIKDMEAHHVYPDDEGLGIRDYLISYGRGRAQLYLGEYGPAMGQPHLGLLRPPGGVPGPPRREHQPRGAPGGAPHRPGRRRRRAAGRPRGDRPAVRAGGGPSSSACSSTGRTRPPSP